jgi:hypothetical protein
MEVGNCCLISATDPARNGLQDTSSSKRCGRAFLAQHKRLTMDGDDGLRDKELAKLMLTRRQLIRLQKNQRGCHFRRPEVDSIPAPMAKRPVGSV